MFIDIVILIGISFVLPFFSYMLMGEDFSWARITVHSLFMLYGFEVVLARRKKKFIWSRVRNRRDKLTIFFSMLILLLFVSFPIIAESTLVILFIISCIVGCALAYWVLRVGASTDLRRELTTSEHK